MRCGWPTFRAALRGRTLADHCRIGCGGGYHCRIGCGGRSGSGLYEVRLAQCGRRKEEEKRRRSEDRCAIENENPPSESGGKETRNSFSKELLSFAKERAGLDSPMDVRMLGECGGCE